MVRVLSTNITSPLGETTELNYQAVKSGCSALTRYEDRWGVQEPFAASLFNDGQTKAMEVEGFTRFESLVLHSVREALSHISFDITSSRVLFVLSTTKGNVEMLGQEDCGDREYPGTTAKAIAHELGITTQPIVVCNACISGVAAQVLALRLLHSGLYDYAIVVGAEVQNKFIVSGFQSFKAVSEDPCRPFDIERLGLNLGEAAATMVLQATDEASDEWHLTNGCVRNDAFHISAPSPKGDGYLLALNGVLDGVDKSALATISVHGTATMYNDQMESKAIQRADCSDIPLTVLKGYYGHTMGAAGVLETILTMRATDDGIVLGTRGFEEIGVSGKVCISNQSSPTDKRTFVKMLSGFGGCNGGVLLTKNPICEQPSHFASPLISHRVYITQDGVSVDGTVFSTRNTGSLLLKELYKSEIDDYPKFYKMDMLTRLAFVASELLLKAEGQTSETPTEGRAIIFFNRTSSIVADRQYMETIQDAENYFPSPSAFVYTLPNITTGEIAIRHQYQGETSFYILAEKDGELMDKIIRTSFLDEKTTSMIAGWIDCQNESQFEAELSIYTL